MRCAFIPARGGSRRLPRKNLREFCGKPLIYWTLEQCRRSYTVDEYFVITDDDEIASFSAMHGAQIIRQPTWMCELGVIGGSVAHAYAIQELDKQNYEVSQMTVLLCTTPTRKWDDIDNAWEQWQKVRPEQRGISCTAPLEHVGLHLIMSHKDRLALGLNMGAGEVHYGWYSHVISWIETECWRYHNFGQNEIDLQAMIEKRNKKTPGRPGPGVYYFVEPWQCVDIDNIHDFELAEFTFQKYILNKEIPKTDVEICDKLLEGTGHRGDGDGADSCEGQGRGGAIRTGHASSSRVDDSASEEA